MNERWNGESWIVELDVNDQLKSIAGISAPAFDIFQSYGIEICINSYNP